MGILTSTLEEMCNLKYGRRQKKVPFYRPYNGMGNTVPFSFPFNFRAVAVLVHFQTVPILS